MKGGRKRVSDTSLTKLVFDALRDGQPLFQALFGVKTLSGTLLGLAFDEKRVMGLGLLDRTDAVGRPVLGL